MLMFILILIIGFIICCNLYVAHTMSDKEMWICFILGQNLIGRICANTFYALAWALKGIKLFVK